MHPNLKEDPKEWRKFALAGALFGSVATLALWRRGSIGSDRFRMAMSVLSLWLFIGLFWPRFLRPVYRGMMTISFYIGQVVGRVLLGFFFLTILTPLGIILRLLGKDLMRLRRDPSAQTYWRSPRPSVDMRRQF